MSDVSASIIHHGAVNGVTGSCHELQWQTPDHHLHGLLVDCGLFQGAEVSGDGSRFEQLEIGFAIDHLQALVVTHVHIDHVGRVPYLLAAGFDKPIYCSEASATLLPLVLEDALKIGFTRNERLIKQFLKQIQSQLRPLPYGQWAEVTDDVSVRLQPAGHILGSAYVELDLSKNDDTPAPKPAPNPAPKPVMENNAASAGMGGVGGSHLLQATRKRVVFSGDLGPPHTPLLRDPVSPERADVMVLESTYGDSLHEDRKQRVSRLQAVIERAVADRGVVLVPAFSIGRTQELLYEMEQIIHQNPEHEDWQSIEVIVDSPLAAKFTDTYRQLRHCWDAEAIGRLDQGRHPLSFESLLTIDDHQTHLQTVDYLAKTARPTIVLAASGMCSGGRVVNYLKALIEDKRTDILFVGYQANGTPGRIIQKYGPRGGYVDLDGKRYDIRAQVHTIGGYSAHADQQNLLDFVAGMQQPPAQLRLVHGDDDAKLTLKREFESQFADSDMEVVIPGG